MGSAAMTRLEVEFTTDFGSRHLRAFFSVANLRLKYRWIRTQVIMRAVSGSDRVRGEARADGRLIAG